MAIKHLSVRMDEELLNKLYRVAEHESRSVNGQITVLIRRCVEEFEKKYGKIEFGKKHLPPEAPADRCFH